MRVPIVQAMLIAEHIYQDLSTKKHVICGVFDRLRLKKRTDLSGSNGNGENRDESDVEGIEVPLEDLRRGGSPMLFLSVTEVEGKIDLTLSYHSLRTGKQYFVLPLTLESDSPLKTLRWRFSFPYPPPRKRRILT
mgnify:CR=1 FL=1